MGSSFSPGKSVVASFNVASRFNAGRNFSASRALVSA